VSEDDFLQQLAAEAARQPTVAPTEQGSAQLRALAVELVDVEASISELEAELSAKNQRRNDLRHRLIPDKMTEVGQDRMGLPGFGDHGADLVSEPYYHANVAADWEPERRDAAFELLDRMDAGDIVKTVVSLSFPRGTDGLASAFRDAIRDPKFETLLREHAEGVNDFELPPVETAKSVPWGTLTAFVREQHRKGRLFQTWMTDAGIDPRVVLGATIGVVAKIKYRKEK